SSSSACSTAASPPTRASPTWCCCPWATGCCSHAGSDDSCTARVARSCSVAPQPRHPPRGNERPVRTFRAAAVAMLSAASLLVPGLPAHAQVAEEATEPPQPSAAVTTRTCEQNGAIIVLNNTGGGTVTFTVLVDNEAFG